MADGLLPLIHQRVHQHRRGLYVLLACGLALSLLGLRFIDLDGNIESMLPASPEVRRSMRFLRESDLAGKVVLSISLKSGETQPSLLIQAVDDLTRKLSGELVTTVTAGIAEAHMITEAQEFMRYTPQLTGSAQLQKVDERMTEAAVAERVAAFYAQLLAPGGNFAMQFFRSDPLGISAALMAKVQALSSSLGYRIRVEQGHFLSEDGRYALMILETPVLLTDGPGSRRLLSHVQQCVGSAQPALTAALVAGHAHTVSNEKVIRRDMRLTCTVASVAFMILFLVVFRDIRAIFVFALPFCAILMAVNLAAFVVGRLSYLVVGFGAVIAGIAVDYGVHVYAAKRRRDMAGIASVARPVVIGALTTMSVFFALFFSSVPGYCQLAWFSILSIVLCLLLALFLLPTLLTGRHFTPSHREAGRQGDDHFFDRWRSGSGRCWIALVWVGLLGVSALSMRDLVVATDVTRMDGSEPHVFAAEREFRQIWGRGDHPAILVIEAPTTEEALRLGEKALGRAAQALDTDKFSAITSIWLARRTRERNLENWNAFWRGGAEARLRRYLARAIAKYGFADDVFQPFFDSLYTSELAEGLPLRFTFFRQLAQRFVVEREDKTMLLSYFEDGEGELSKLAAVLEGDPGTFVVSPRALSTAISESVSAEIAKLSAIAGTLIIALILLLLRNLRLAALGLVPVVSSLAAVLATLPLLGISLTAPSIMATMVVVGLCVDYGVFVVYDLMQREDNGTHLAVALSALTTLIGAGSLLFARHPVMFAIGITLAIGVGAGYVSAVFVVPALYGLTERKQ